MYHLPRFLKMHLWLPTFPRWKLCLPGPWQWNLEQLMISMGSNFCEVDPSSMRLYNASDTMNGQQHEYIYI